MNQIVKDTHEHNKIEWKGLHQVCFGQLLLPHAILYVYTIKIIVQREQTRRKLNTHLSTEVEKFNFSIQVQYSWRRDGQASC